MRTDAVDRWRAWIVALSLACAGLAGGQEPTADPPQSAATGSVTGVVRSGASGKAIAGARVDVIGTQTSAQTDADGAFRLALPAGAYTVRITAEGFSNRTVPRLVIGEGKTARIEIKLSEPVKAEKDSVIVNVIARLRRAAEAAQLARRQKASAVSETISAETMKKSTGSDATAAVQRSTGVTIRDSGGSKTVFVRGLGERYTTAMLNGSRLPSPDALKRAVPLDLFPSDFLEGIDIVKGYTPDLPGDFAGGLIDMRLRDFPDKPTYSIGVATGGNSESTGRDFLTYKGGGPADYFGYGEAARSWPQDTPSFSIDELSPSRNYALGREFHNVWSPETQRAPVDFGGTFSVGDSIGPLGYQLGAIYSARWRTISNQLKRQLQNQGKDFSQFNSNQSTFVTRLGAILTTAYRLADNHTLTLRSFFNQASADQTRFETGVDTQANLLRQTQLRYVQDELAFGQLGGEHRFDFLLVDWRSALSRVTRDEPDTRHTTYIKPENSVSEFTFSEQSLGGLRISNNTRETLSDSGLDFTVPFVTGFPGSDLWAELPAKLKFGAAYSDRRRSFAQRRVQFQVDAGGVNLTQSPEQIFAPPHFGPGGVMLDETTTPQDEYQGTQEVLAGYTLLELPIVRDTLRLVAGARVENSNIQLDTSVVSTDLCGGSQSVCPQSFVKNNFDVMPGVNLIYNPARDMNVRLSWSQTVSRPELRELAPTEFPAQRGDNSTQGNPDLVEFGITSYDARWEWFFSPLELVSLGFFYKTIDKPIEKFTLYVSTEPIDTFANTGAASLYGFELEARKDFGFIRPALRDLSTTINFTWADSEVDVGQPVIQGFKTFPTSPKRRMIGQAPFIANGSVEYSRADWGTARLTYFTSQRALDSAGSAGYPDTYEERRDRLDFVLIVPLQRWLGAPITSKLFVENILNDQIQYTQGRYVTRRSTDGTSFGIGFTYTH